jgi:hypothetical protein
VGLELSAHAVERSLGFLERELGSVALVHQDLPLSSPRLANLSECLTLFGERGGWCVAGTLSCAA